MAESEHHQVANDTGVFLKKLDAIVWGSLFIWIAIVLLANLGWGVGLLGAGVITLGAQAARTYFGIAVERFWLVIGFVFVLWGVSELLNIQRDLLPILLLVTGIALVVSAFLRKTGS